MNFYDKAIKSLKEKNYDDAAKNFFNHIYYNNSKGYPKSENYSIIEDIEKIRYGTKEYYFNIINVPSYGDEIKAYSYAKLGIIYFYIDNKNFIEYFNKVYLLSKDYYLLNLIGIVFLKNGKYDMAIKFLEKSKELSNYLVSGVLYNLHTAYLMNYECDKATYYLNEVKKLDNKLYIEEENMINDTKLRYARLLNV